LEIFMQAGLRWTLGDMHGTNSMSISAGTLQPTFRYKGAHSRTPHSYRSIHDPAGRLPAVGN
jgi:hypothetical protein